MLMGSPKQAYLNGLPCSSLAIYSRISIKLEKKVCAANEEQGQPLE